MKNFKCLNSQINGCFFYSKKDSINLKSFYGENLQLKDLISFLNPFIFIQGPIKIQLFSVILQNITIFNYTLEYSSMVIKKSVFSKGNN